MCPYKLFLLRITYTTLLLKITNNIFPQTCITAGLVQILLGNPNNATQNILISSFVRRERNFSYQDIAELNNSTISFRHINVVLLRLGRLDLCICSLQLEKSHKTKLSGYVFQLITPFRLVTLLFVQLWARAGFQTTINVIFELDKNQTLFVHSVKNRVEFRM